MLQVRQTKPLAPTQKVKVEKQNKNNRLPNECLEDDMWSTNVVSSMLIWASCHRNLWSINDGEMAYALSLICPLYYTPETIAEMSLNDLACPAVQIVSRVQYMLITSHHSYIVDEPVLH
jgi:hypothetical protein